MVVAVVLMVVLGCTKDYIYLETQKHEDYFKLFSYDNLSCNLL